MFPYMLFFLILFVFVIQHSTTSLVTEGELVHAQEEEIQLETLLYSSYEQFQENLNTLEPSTSSQRIHYNYPNGNVEITYSWINDNQIEAKFIIDTHARSRLTRTLLFPYVKQTKSE